MAELALSELELIQDVLNALRKLPTVRAELLAEEVTADNYRLDAKIALHILDHLVILRVEAKRELYPRDVHEVLWRMGTTSADPDAINFIAADSISPGAKQLLQAERVGYYDRGGSLFIPAAGAYIYIDKPPPKSISRAARALFRGRRAQVIHALLLHPQEWLTGKDLASKAQVSTATVSQVIAELERMELLRPNDQGPHKGRQVREPGVLLDQWAEQVSKLKHLQSFRRFFLPARRGEQVILDAVANSFALHSVDYAVSFEAAAQAYAPFLTSVSQIKCRALRGPALENALGALDAKPVEEGANFYLIETKFTGELLFRELNGDAWLASPIQVYLDLLRSEGRAKELAQHLRTERLGF